MQKDTNHKQSISKTSVPPEPQSRGSPPLRQMQIEMIQQ
jgi:hypothetical protein